MKAIDVYNAVKTWSTVHTVATAAIIGALTGFLAGKIL